MRFRIGQVYQGDFPGEIRQAAVKEIWDEGREGKLAFADNGREFTVRWVELHLAGKWHQVSP
jgi:hypothetical protein